MVQKINVLSLFDGISIAQQALKQEGIKTNKYIASEIDPYAIKVCQANFPETIQLGDVRNVSVKDLPRIDLLVAGFPCTDLSIIGSRKGLKGERSGLFYSLLKILKEVKRRNPRVKWLIENVASMNPKERHTISRLLGLQPILINSNLVSAQNRSRLYWTNIPGVTIPQDQGINLQSILQKNQPTCTTGRNVIAKLKITGNPFDYALSQLKMKSQAFTGVKDVRKLKVIKCDRLLKVKKNQQKSSCLLSAKGGNNGKMDLLVFKNGKVRKLTAIEAERLQALPDNYTSAVSNSRRHVLIGNGFTVSVIAHILSFLR